MNKPPECYGPLNIHHYNKILSTVLKAVAEHTRTTAIRVDLRLPVINSCQFDTDTPSFFVDIDSSVISRFMSSLDAQIKSDLSRKAKMGKRTFANTLRYVWVKEYSQEHKAHYHIVIFLNKDNYAHIGDYSALEGNLASKIRQAWCRALGVDCEYFKHLVHFPKDCVYYLNNNSSNYEFEHDLNALMFRLAYLAKKETKHHIDGCRCFGCSQR
jgi:hypothetical protein